MKQQSLKRQAAWITAVECAVRCLGFFQRLLVSRWLGAEAVGVMELASFAHMPALAPAASGLPGAVSRLTAKAPRPEDRLLILAAACLAGAACAAALYMAAPLIACTLYRLPEVAPLIRSLCPLAVVLPLQQVLTGLMGGLGLQKQTLADSLLGTAATLFFTLRWTASLGILGAGYASLLGHGVTVFCAALHLGSRIFRPRPEQYIP